MIKIFVKVKTLLKKLKEFLLLKVILSTSCFFIYTPKPERNPPTKQN